MRIEQEERFDKLAIIKVIDEAHDMGGNLALTGGDIFAFPDWKEVIRKVGQYGFTPLLSTKIPLKEDDIYFLKSLELNSCQFSIWNLYFPLTLQYQW